MSYTSSLKALATAGAAVLFAASLAAAQTDRPKPDNTRENTRDRQAGTVTADQQGNSVTDLDATKKIREAIVRDKSLSTYAHNVKVITRDGTVTLKGPVRSEDEKKAVEAKALSVIGAGHVVNELTVAPPSKHH
jgi:osmotically-inducible protein OsmY